MVRSPKDDATELLNALLPLAEKLLKEHGEFFPYGGAMLPDGSITMVAASEGMEHPPSQKLIDLLVGSVDAQLIGVFHHQLTNYRNRRMEIQANFLFSTQH